MSVYDPDTEYEYQDEDWTSGSWFPARWVGRTRIAIGGTNRDVFYVEFPDGGYVVFIDGKASVRLKRKIAQTFYEGGHGNIFACKSLAKQIEAKELGYPIGHRYEGSRVIEWEDE